MGGCRRAWTLACVATLAFAGGARAQQTATVPLDAAVYRHIDALASAGLIDSLIVGQRPYSRREVVRLLNEAGRNLDRLPRERARTAARMIVSDLELYGRWGLSGLEWMRVEGGVLNSPWRAIPADSNGRVDATINPLAANRAGRPLYDGANLTLETRHVYEPSPRASLFLEPRVTVAAERGRRATSQLRLQSGGLGLLFGNLTISAGRDAITFGQAPSGGLVLSSNAPPLDMIRLSTDRPAKLPWIFGLLGPVRGTAFIADLGRNQNFPHAKLIGYKLSAAIHPRFELGAQVIDEMGGRGSPPGSFGDRLADLMPLIDIFRSSDYLFSNKYAGIDFRWRWPRAAGFELFFDGAVDDLDGRRWKSTLLEDAGYIAGFSFACLRECGSLGVRAEYHQTGIRYYTHAQFTSGIAQNGTLLGDPLGPRGLGGYVTIDQSPGRYGTITLGGAFEVRSGNRYGAAVTGPEDRGFHFVRLERHPGEKRARATIGWRGAERSGATSARFVLGLEHVHNFEFVGGRNRTNVLAQIGMEVRP